MGAAELKFGPTHGPLNEAPHSEPVAAAGVPQSMSDQV